MHRRAIWVLGAVAAVFVVAVLGAWAGASGSARPLPGASTKDPPAESPQGEGNEGGPARRFHGEKRSDCPLPEGVALDGNWTHGAFVSAWAKAGNRSKVTEAAHSACGKPIHAVTKSTESRRTENEAEPGVGHPVPPTPIPAPEAPTPG